MGQSLGKHLQPLPGPGHIGTDHWFSQQPIQGVQFPTQVFFIVLFVDEGVTRSTHIDAPGAHLFATEILAKPLVAVTGSWNQVVKGDLLITAAQLAGTFFTHRPGQSIPSFLIL